MFRNSTSAFAICSSLRSRGLQPRYAYRASLQRRAVATSNTSDNDVRKTLTTELKNAMKSKDTFASTVLRSVLAEVYSADKSSSGPLSSTQIASILRKAIVRRTYSETQFLAAQRQDLAEAERREADFLANFLPPPMSKSDIDDILQKFAAEQNLTPRGTDSNRATGMLLKAFFGQVDKSLVDGKVVKQRAQVILGTSR